MTSTNPWSDIPKGGGNFWKPEKPGDQITGTILDVGIAADFNGNPCPKLTINTGDGERIVTAGQANLKRQLQELGETNPPKAGDKIRITFTGYEKMSRGDMKVFTVEHQVVEPVNSGDLF